MTQPHLHQSGTARWCVVVTDPRPDLLDPSNDEPPMVIGPFTSEVRAEKWARKINEGTELAAEVCGMYGATDSNLKIDLLHWSRQIEERL